jgi:hypothetical protein
MDFYIRIPVSEKALSVMTSEKEAGNGLKA